MGELGNGPILCLGKGKGAVLGYVDGLAGGYVGVLYPLVLSMRMAIMLGGGCMVLPSWHVHCLIPLAPSVSP